MSKLSRAIDAAQTGRVKLTPQTPSLIEVTDDVRKVTSMQQVASYEYRLGAVFQIKGLAKDPTELTRVKDLARRAILQEVFGEFRSLIHQIEIAVANYEIEKAVSLLRQLDNEMFS